MANDCACCADCDTTDDTDVDKRSLVVSLVAPFVPLIVDDDCMDDPSTAVKVVAEDVSDSVVCSVVAAGDNARNTTTKSASFLFFESEGIVDTVVTAVDTPALWTL